MGESVLVREAVSDEDLIAWARIKREVLPNDSAWTPEQFRAMAEPTRRVTIAELDGEVVGCGLGGRSDVEGRCFLSPRVPARHRGKGVGTALYRDLLAFVATIGRPTLVGYVEDHNSLAWAEGRGFVETDRQVEQVIHLEARIELPPLPDGVEVLTIEERPELLAAAYPLAQIGFADMALHGDAMVSEEHWMQFESTLPGGSFVALHDGEIVGYSGLCEHDNEGSAEDGLTVVARDWRGRGLSLALKQRELEWARTHGIREVITWTQKNNDGMRAANERLGYVYRDVAITMEAELASVWPAWLTDE